MSSAQKMLAREDLVKLPQRKVEGHTPATYGVTPGSSSFDVKLQRALISKSNEPVFIDNDYGGTYDRQGVRKVREANTLNIKGRLTPYDIDLLKWGFNLPDEAGTPQESHTWADSYNDNSGTEIFRVWQGVKPVTTTLTLINNDADMLEIAAACKTFTESSAHGLTSPTFGAGEVDGQALGFENLGAFTYGGDEYAFTGATITVTFSERVQDSNGSLTALYREPSMRRITGSFDIFKKGAALNEDARKGTQKAANLILHDKSGSGTAASLQSNSGSNYITYTADTPGTYGNGISVRQRSGSADLVEVSNKDITITYASGTTIAEVAALVNADPEASALVTAAVTGTGTTAVGTLAKTNLSGGTETETRIVFERLRWLPSNEDLIEQSAATIESKSFEADGIEVITA